MSGRRVGEAELAFAALHQMCTFGHLDRILEPQRDALRTVFGLRTGPAPDPLLLGLSVLSLLAAAAAERPLVCVIDDAQWLDRASAQTLGIVARRLLAESVALVFALRDDDRNLSLTGIAEVVVGGLPDADAWALLARAIPGGPWTSASEPGSWPRRAGTRWRCWNCRAG